jgi:hypothetical protein
LLINAATDGLGDLVGECVEAANIARAAKNAKRVVNSLPRSGRIFWAGDRNRAAAEAYFFTGPSRFSPTSIWAEAESKILLDNGVNIILKSLVSR